MSQRLPSYRKALTALRPADWLALSWLALLLAVAVTAPYLPLPYPVATPDLLHLATPPTWAGLPPHHYLGTDPLGRDVLAELVLGTRQLLTLTLPATVLAMLLGALAGGAAGYWGNRGLHLPLAWLLWLLAVVVLVLALPFAGWLAGGLAAMGGWLAWRQSTKRWAVPLASGLRATLALLGSTPRLLLLLALVAGPPLPTGYLLLVLAALTWPEAARLVYVHMLRVRELPFVEAARANGLPTGRIWWHHALPHACQPLAALGPLSVAGLIGLESTLGFLGIGLSPATASWGQLLGTVRLEPGAWWLVAAPGLPLVATLLALHRVAGLAASSRTVAGR